MNFPINEPKIRSTISTTPSDISYLPNTKRLSLHDFAILMNAQKYQELCAQKAREITLTRFGNVKFAYIPLYLSNECINECAYCGFNTHNKLKRKTLTKNEIKNELTEIYSQGFRSILLVSGEVDTKKWQDYFVCAIKIARDIGFHSIAVEIGVLDEETASKFLKAGAETFTLYQETYHKNTYKKLHGKGPKSDYHRRIDSIEIALKSGFQKATMGFLGGLYEPQFETLALYQHISYLKKKYWNREFSISIPRITKAHNVAYEKYRIDDALFAQILITLRLAFPDTAILLSTRETPKFRNGMLNICATNLSIASKTFPGGYSESGEQLEQFATNDNRGISEISSMLKNNGYDLCFKDWEQALH